VTTSIAKKYLRQWELPRKIECTVVKCWSLKFYDFLVHGIFMISVASLFRFSFSLSLSLSLSLSPFLFFSTYVHFIKYSFFFLYSRPPFVNIRAAKVLQLFAMNPRFLGVDVDAQRWNGWGALESLKYFPHKAFEVSKIFATMRISLRDFN